MNCTWMYMYYELYSSAANTHVHNMQSHAHGDKLSYYYGITTPSS